MKTLYANYRDAKNLTDENVFVGVGSDEAIDLLFRIFLTPNSKEHVIVCPPTYGMYQVCATINDCKLVKVPLTSNFELQVDVILGKMNKNTKLIFVCSPGNPTSKLISLDDIERLANSKYTGILVIDEAYIDFSPTSKSAITLLTKYKNIIVLQTLSKAFGLAGIRCGFAISSNTEIIQLMNNVKAPYNLSSLTSEKACYALNTIETLTRNVDHIFVERNRLKKFLEEIQFVVHVYDSDSNILLFQLKSHANETYKYMADHGVVCRFRGKELHCRECLRVTVGTREENDFFLEGLRAGFLAVGGMAS